LDTNYWINFQSIFKQYECKDKEPSKKNKKGKDKKKLSDDEDEDSTSKNNVQPPTEPE
jgi:hypothetical protein